MLELLDKITNDAEYKYPSETDLEEEVIKQLTALKEQRAVDGLRRIIRFDVEAYRDLTNFLVRNKAIVVGQAIEALLEITNGAYLEEVQGFINYGIEEGATMDYDPEKDKFAAIRYHLVRGLRYAESEQAKALLVRALQDPHHEVKVFAHEVLQRKLGR